MPIKPPGFSTYEFLRRTSFEISQNFDRLETLLRERLRQMVSNSAAAFDALCTRLDKLGGTHGGRQPVCFHPASSNESRSQRHSPSRGAMLVPVISISQVCRLFANTSAIGRSWHRHIAGQRISSPVVNELLSRHRCQETCHPAHGLPGSGKTCVLSCRKNLSGARKHKGTWRRLFIQSREFADLATAQERQTQGLPDQWVEQVARLVEDVHVVVIIDSPDVLSIAREHSVLTYFLAQIDQLLLIPNVTVITACRDFDRKYDRSIAARKWDTELQCLPLDLGSRNCAVARQARNLFHRH